MSEFKVGDAVRVERDEDLYPSRGTWPRYRNRPGFVVQLNHDADEIGVVLTLTRPRWRTDPGHEGDLAYDSDQVSWFRPYELRHRREG